jgi:hypothetical protein
MRTHAITPLALRRPKAPARIALVDVDNIALGGNGDLRPDWALEQLDAISREVSGAELVYAVASQGLVRGLGLWFRYPEWTFRPAEVGPDAADHQLLAYGRCALRQRPGARLIVASGDHIFADLADTAALQVVAPMTHCGVSARLRPWLRRVATGPAVAPRAA